jgi:hypothetical protein
MSETSKKDLGYRMVGAAFITLGLTVFVIRLGHT